VFLQPGKAKAPDWTEAVSRSLFQRLQGFCGGSAGNKLYFRGKRGLAMADQDKLTTALDNLLRNAMDAMEELPERIGGLQFGSPP
jgi:signal transduction histidine kinase